MNDGPPDPGSRELLASTRTQEVHENVGELTPARVGIGRVGVSLPTAARLQLRLDHARARDAVRHAFDADGVVEALTATGREAIAVTSAAVSRDEYVRRPDLGRSLPVDAASALRRPGVDRCDLAIVLCDGLSPGAIERYGPALVERITSNERLGGWSIGPVAVVCNGRVAIGDAIGELLGADIVVVLIGERPGLTISESVGAYLTFGPRAGRTDADRNCISNIHAGERMSTTRLDASSTSQRAPGSPGRRASPSPTTPRPRSHRATPSVAMSETPVSGGFAHRWAWVRPDCRLPRGGDDNGRRMSSDHDAGVVGFDVPTIERWLATVTTVRSPIVWQRLPGGHSNLTYLLVDDAGRELVIRRPPLGELLPKAHDMWREYRVIEALWPTTVPVPEPIAYCDDRSIADTHFYVMGKAEGRALYSGAEVAHWLDVPARRRAGESFIDVLARLHSITPADIGLDDLGRHDGYVARQLRTWYGSWTSSVAHAEYDDPRVHEVHDRLAASIPEAGPARVVHGDYGPHNSLFAATGELTAVLDWEIATLGDPLADFAYTLNAWAEPGDVGVDGLDPATALPGFPSRDELTDRYAKATGADLTHLDFYRSFNQWKTACILHGVYARYRVGQKDTAGVDLPMLRQRMQASVAGAAALADRAVPG